MNFVLLTACGSQALVGAEKFPEPVGASLSAGFYFELGRGWYCPYQDDGLSGAVTGAWRWSTYRRETLGTRRGPAKLAGDGLM